ncbi:hypothetical protein RFI_37921 [Reticulomyxa filosa]|uniref:Uncharacterized protein n=1 Tax=Reticulomyxa filosa TaxID=46433 RepID=X6LFN1_RETFI|nr:hypothetical protein RFI_37921 [Reticulomyxa filosa]|eukprot:ETN99549.1 hypothetical protein RFI_37921 [Reticulomyxa filosa]
MLKVVQCNFTNISDTEKKIEHTLEHSVLVFYFALFRLFFWRKSPVNRNNYLYIRLNVNIKIISRPKRVVEDYIIIYHFYHSSFLLLSTCLINFYNLSQSNAIMSWKKLLMIICQLPNGREDLYYFSNSRQCPQTALTIQLKKNLQDFFILKDVHNVEYNIFLLLLSVLSLFATVSKLQFNFNTFKKKMPVHTKMHVRKE